LTVIDDGNGFNIAETGSKKTFGFLGMRERALMFGGVCDISSFPGKGTIITAKVPIKPKSKKNAHSDSR
jgi:signal transduction histidine kinase